MLLPLATLLRLASRIACLVVVVSFAIFALEQTSEASSHQQNEVTGTASGTAAPHTQKHSQEGTVHRVIDEVANALISPFSGITAGSTSQWAIRGVGTVLALLVYGIGVGYLARTLRIRV